MINGGAGNDSLDGGTGAPATGCGSGNRRYPIASTTPAIAVIESACNATHTVNTMISYGLTAEMENPASEGGADLQGYGMPWPTS